MSHAKLSSKMIKHRSTSSEQVAPQDQLDIVYRDQYVIAIHKPAGLLVHKSPIDKRETRYAMKLLRDQIGQWVYPAHRLDKPTSGLLLFALDPETAKQLGTQFEHRLVSKRYQALVRGYTPEQGEIDHALSEIAAFKDQQAKADLKEAKEAQTHYQRLAQFELPVNDGRFPTSRYSLLELRPITGRKHQIRRHLKHISHPIIGDVKYGKGPHNRLFREQYQCERLMLACTELKFEHPSTGDTLCLQASPETSFSHTIAQLGRFQVPSNNNQ